MRLSITYITEVLKDGQWKPVHEAKDMDDMFMAMCKVKLDDKQAKIRARIVNVWLDRSTMEVHVEETIA
ncbi:MAG: hypothetical protein D6746_10445 [Bacteroidetes bacterium]|nr:MAG: hypothetical protein D6746_10445 [Bacteroidota bacterium]